MASFKPFQSVNASADRLQSKPCLVPGLIGTPGQFYTQTDISGTVDINAPLPVATMPSVQIVRRSNGGVSLLIRLNSNYAAMLDDTGIERMAARMTEQMRDFSHGRLSTKRLRQMGHPYGRSSRGLMRGKLGRGIGRVAGFRGSVPNLTIINEQTGVLARSWDYRVRRDAQGVLVNIFNTAPEAWYVIAGTARMQAHGPMAFVLKLWRAAMLSEWSGEASRAYHVDKARAQLLTTLRMA